MKSAQKPPSDIDSYIARFPVEIQTILKKIRTTIKNAVPKAEETIKYGMPTFTTPAGHLVYFAAFKKHIGLFPPTSGDGAYRKAASAYEGPKGNLKFSLDAAIPYDLITRMVKFRLKESQTRATAKRQERQP